MAYVVKAAAAVVNVEGGFASLMLKGSVLPDNVDKAQLQHLLDNGLVVEVDDYVGGLEPVFTGDLESQVTATDPADLEDDVDGDGPIPAKSATKDVWVDYAVSQGADRTEAEGLTKQELIDRYGSVAAQPAASPSPNPQPGPAAS